jgi:methionyl-tRNA synthetase
MPDPAPSPATPAPAGDGKIVIDDFRKVQLRVAKILEVADHPNADKLFVVKVDLGSEQRTICAGIKPYFPDPKVLVGKTVVIVANLQPRPLRGVESNGMILAATGAGTVTPLTVMGDVPPGSVVS